MTTPNDKRGSGGTLTAGAPHGGAPRPDLKVGNIEIYGGQVVIGGVAMTPPSPGGAVPGTAMSMPASSAPPPVPGSAPTGQPPFVPAPSTQPSPPMQGTVAAPIARPGALVRQAGPDRSGVSATAALQGAVQTSASAVGSSSDTDRADVALRRPAVGTSLDSALLELFPPVATPMGKVMVAGASVGLGVCAYQLISLGLPAELVFPGVVGIGAMGLFRILRHRRRASALSDGTHAHESGSAETQPGVSAAERERALVLLADRQGGIVRVVDVVRELRLSFDEAQSLLTTLCSKGHASVEFDPQTQSPVYRIGG